MKERPELLTDSSVVSVGEIIEVCEQEMLVTMPTIQSIVEILTKCPEEDQYNDDAHDEEAAFHVEALAHDAAHSLGHTDGALTNNDDCEQAHTFHQMRLLEAEHAPETRDTDDRESLQGHHSVPDKVHQAEVSTSRLERHANEDTCGEQVESDHEADGKVQLRVTSFEGEVL